MFKKLKEKLKKKDGSYGAPHGLTHEELSRLAWDTSTGIYHKQSGKPYPQEVIEKIANEIFYNPGRVSKENRKIADRLVKSVKEGAALGEAYKMNEERDVADFGARLKIYDAKPGQMPRKYTENEVEIEK